MCGRSPRPCLLLWMVAVGISAAPCETSVVQTQQTVTAAAGGEAHLSCWLTQPKDVFQVTWQKISSGVLDENIGSYNERYGDRVVFKFRGKVLIGSGMQNSSIVVRNVSEEDGGCFLCLFSTDPEGSLKGRTCLQVYELHPPVLHVRASDSPAESVVICSATGRPAPNLTLTVGQQHLNSSHNRTVNHNNTVTVTAAAVLSGLDSSSTQVGCSAAVFSGPQLQASLLLHGLDVDPRSVHGRGRLALILAAVMMGAVLISVLIFFMWRLHS